MSTEIRIAADQTVSAHWTGPKGRGSLFQCIAPGRCEEVNALDLDELLTARACSHLTPFSVPGFTASREKTLAVCQAEKIVERAFPPGHDLRVKHSLGEVRRAFVLDMGDSAGGPLDGWISWLAERKRQAEGDAAADHDRQGTPIGGPAS